MDSEEGGNVVRFEEREEPTKPKSRRKRAYAVDLGLRQRLEGCEGEMIAYFCSSKPNGSMRFVCDDEVKTSAGGRRSLVCYDCETAHLLITIEEAVRTYFVIGVWSNAGSDDVCLSTEHETLLLNRLELMRRTIAGRNGGQAIAAG